MSEKEFLLNFACIELSHAKEILDESKKYIQAFDRMLDERRARGKLDGNWMNGGTGQDVFRWWMEEDVLPGQMSVEDFV